MATYVIDSKEDLAKRNTIQSLVDAGELPVMTTITKRPADLQCWQGVYYGGQWYPPSDPRGAELDRMRYMLPAGKVEELVKSTPVVLGRTEIEMGEGQYHRPGLAVRHSSQEKRLAVTFYANGRTGKQKNFWPLRVTRTGDQIEIDTHGASKSVVPLAEWQVFIDQVDVRVTDISRNTVDLTPALVAMARDVKAYRRKEPTDLEWKAENGAEVKPASDADLMKNWQKWMDAEVEANHNGFYTEYSGFILVGDLDLVKETGPRDFKDIVFRNSGIKLDEPGKQHEPPYNRYSQVLINITPEQRERNQSWRPAGSGTKRYPEHNELSAVLRAAKDGIKAPQASPEPRSEAKPPTPVVLPQSLQSREDVLEAIAMSKVEPSPERVTELYEAVVFGVEHSANEEARTIFDGFFLRKSPNGAFIHLAHKDHPNHVTVGMADLVTGKMQFCSSRGELKDYMHRVSSGVKPSGNGKLPGVLVQQPIPEDAKQAPLRSGNNHHAEIAPDALPLFAEQDTEPESAV